MKNNLKKQIKKKRKKGKTAEFTAAFKGSVSRVHLIIRYRMEIRGMVEKVVRIIEAIATWYEQTQ